MSQPLLSGGPEWRLEQSRLMESLNAWRVILVEVWVEVVVEAMGKTLVVVAPQRLVVVEKISLARDVGGCVVWVLLLREGVVGRVVVRLGATIHYYSFIRF